MFKFKSTKKVIEQIHSEFDGASERLLREAKAILNKPIEDEKAKKLRKLGFDSSSSVKKATEQQAIANQKKEVMRFVEYYATNYPNNKFITEEIVKEICKKYNLLCGPIGRYTGDVPMKNILEMEHFSLRKEDMGSRTKYDDHLYYQRFSGIGQSRSFLLGGIPEYIQPSMSFEEIEKLKKEVYYVKESFKICAPEKDFNTAGMTKFGHKLIPDPIVLQPIKGGYLIVTKWGLEGDDPALLNEKHN